jgi:hypothetical protein
MTMHFDKYFVYAFAELAGAFLGIFTLIFIGIRHKKLGKIMFWLFITIFGLFDLVQWADMMATLQRPNEYPSTEVKK